VVSRETTRGEAAQSTADWHYIELTATARIGVTRAEPRAVFG
jgi:hypothetical protein